MIKKKNLTTENTYKRYHKTLYYNLIIKTKKTESKFRVNKTKTIHNSKLYNNYIQRGMKTFKHSVRL